MGWQITRYHGAAFQVTDLTTHTRDAVAALPGATLNQPKLSTSASHAINPPSGRTAYHLTRSGAILAAMDGIGVNRELAHPVGFVLCLAVMILAWWLWNRFMDR